MAKGKANGNGEVISTVPASRPGCGAIGEQETLSDSTAALSGTTTP